MPQASMSVGPRDLSTIATKAWTNEEFKRQLMANPVTVLQEHGVKTVPGVQVKVVENSNSVTYLTVPTRPTKPLTKEEIDRLVQENILEHPLWGAEIIHVLIRAAGDDTFKKRLAADPAAVLKEHGMQVPTGMQLKVLENTDREYWLTLPEKPDRDTEELSEGDLTRIVGGGHIGGSIWHGGQVA